jgi:hypothetical protein
LNSYFGIETTSNHERLGGLLTPTATAASLTSPARATPVAASPRR